MVPSAGRPHTPRSHGLAPRALSPSLRPAIFSPLRSLAHRASLRSRGDLCLAHTCSGCCDRTTSISQKLLVSVRNFWARGCPALELLLLIPAARLWEPKRETPRSAPERADEQGRLPANGKVMFSRRWTGRGRKKQSPERGPRGLGVMSARAQSRGNAAWRTLLRRALVGSASPP